jgi:hypothetical protein
MAYAPKKFDYVNTGETTPSVLILELIAYAPLFFRRLLPIRARTPCNLPPLRGHAREARNCFSHQGGLMKIGIENIFRLLFEKSAKNEFKATEYNG